jgi:hypothetical protein
MPKAKYRAGLGLDEEDGEDEEDDEGGDTSDDDGGGWSDDDAADGEEGGANTAAATASMMLHYSLRGVATFAYLVLAEGFAAHRVPVVLRPGYLAQICTAFLHELLVP